MLQSALYFIITFNHCQPLTLNSFCFNIFRVITFNVCWSFVVLTLDLYQFSPIFPLEVFSYVFFALCFFSSWGCGMHIAQNVWAGLRTTFRTQLCPLTRYGAAVNQIVRIGNDHLYPLSHLICLLFLVCVHACVRVHMCVHTCMRISVHLCVRAYV